MKIPNIWGFLNVSWRLEYFRDSVELSEGTLRVGREALG